LVYELPHEFVAVKVDVPTPIVFCYVPIFIKIKQPEKLLTLLFIDVTGNLFARSPNIIFEKDLLF
jgi:hypothetical protein